MLTMDKICDIRNRYFRKGEKITQISKALKVDQKTVRKYIDPRFRSTAGSFRCTLCLV